ncbi:MAG: RNA polymerase sporulation sigma factor SigK [Limnochordaceae bacterium]|nr:RNA polymerase sporulation sigma factor SigK [Limnochordaceae bacterium]
MLPSLLAWGSWLLDLAALAGLVSGGGAFPPPLPREEEEEWIRRLEQGDGQAAQVLAERNLRLVAHIAKKYDTSGEDPDDLISIGTIGLVKAIRTFNSHQNTRLATYAARCIHNEILMYLRSRRHSRQDAFLSEPVGADREGNEVTLMDVLGGDSGEVYDRVENRVEQERLWEQFQHLTQRERWVLTLRYGLHDGVERTQREISKLLGVSRSYVSRIEKRALLKLAAAMNLNHSKVQ